MNALSQLEDQVKENQYAEIAQTLGVRFPSELQLQSLKSLPPGCETDSEHVQTLHVCTAYFADLAAYTRDTRGTED